MQREFKGIWIPAHIWNDDSLSAVAKVLLAEVDSFTARDQSFYKTNDTIARELHCSESTIKRIIADLVRLGHVERVAFDGRRRALRSTLDPAARSDSPASKVKWTQQPDQNEPPARSKGTTSNTTSKPVRKPKKVKRAPAALPWEGFSDAWARWTEYKQQEHGFKFKTTASEQAALTQLQNLSNNDESTARQIIEQSLANGWKGLFALKGKQASNPTAADRDQFAHYLRTGSLGPDA